MDPPDYFGCATLLVAIDGVLFLFFAHRPERTRLKAFDHKFRDPSD
jgi:hypothetical protein